MANRTVSNERRSKRKAPKLGSSKKGSATALRGRISALREELEKAAAGLNYSSESDYPFRFFTLPAEDETDLTPQGFLGVVLKLRARDRPMPGNLKRGQFD